MFSVLVATATLIDGFAAGLYVGHRWATSKKTAKELVHEAKELVEVAALTVKEEVAVAETVKAAAATVVAPAPRALSSLDTARK